MEIKALKFTQKIDKVFTQLRPASLAESYFHDMHISIYEREIIVIDELGDQVIREKYV